MGHGYDKGTLKKPYTPQETPERGIMFKVAHLMPPWEEVQHLYNSHDPWEDLFESWFFSGFRGFQVDSNDGIDPNAALKHVRCVMRSFEPSHEHKTASCTFLLKEWFRAARYRQKDSDEWVYINSSDEDWKEEEEE